MFLLDDGLKWISDEFKFCKPLTKNDVPALKSYLNDLWTNVAMMDYPYSTSFLMPLPGNPVKVVELPMKNAKRRETHWIMILFLSANLQIHNVCGYIF